MNKIINIKSIFTLLFIAATSYIMPSYAMEREKNASEDSSGEYLGEMGFFQDSELDISSYGKKSNAKYDEGNENNHLKHFTYTLSLFT